MGRRSQFAEHKAEIRRRVLAGASLATLRLEFGSGSAIGVPESTLQCWFRRFRAEPAEAPILDPDLVDIDDPLRTKFDKAEQMLWHLAEHGGSGPADGVKVQSLNTLLRLFSERSRHFPRSIKQFVDLLIACEITPQEFMSAFVAAHDAQRNRQAVREEFDVGEEELGF